MSNVFEIVKFLRRKNKLKREIQDNDRKIRDNQKRVTLLENLLDYIQPEMSRGDIVEIVKNMKVDYEDRIDDHIIKGAEISKERGETTRQIKELMRLEREVNKTMS
ncbi:DUF496 family protein [Candidatus Enterovibrio escicola]|nr:DUF496 family protein [Candidatus Enterovibrio escacola]